VGTAWRPSFSPRISARACTPNRSTDPQARAYLAAQADRWAAYRLEVGGLVATPLSLTLAQITALPAQSQITRHDCVEGWSCITKWTGPRLSALLEMARPLPGARFVVFHCMDEIERSLSGVVTYHESIDMVDARHPQTILAYSMNDAPLPVRNGAPLRVRVERRLGYKLARYIRRIDLVADFTGIVRERGELLGRPGI